MTLFFFFFTKDTSKKENYLYIENFQKYQSHTEDDLKYLVSYGFEDNQSITVGQLLTFFCRLKGINPSNLSEVQEYCKDKINLPNFYVYNYEEWKNLWSFIMSSDTVFEKVSDEYVLTIIPGLKVYLNQYGYDLMNKGLIPPQLSFYSLGTVDKLDEVSMKLQADFGFFLEVLMALDYENQHGLSRVDCVKENIKEEILRIKPDADLKGKDSNLYNYYALSNYGQLLYFQEKGYFQDYGFSELFSYVDSEKIVNILFEVGI